MKALFKFFLCMIIGHNWTKDTGNSMFHLWQCNNCNHTTFKINDGFKLQD